MRKLLTLVLPIAFRQFMLALVSASDALMPGRCHSDREFCIRGRKIDYGWLE